MARVTDDERRVVEGRLRELAERKVPCDIDCYIAEAVMGHDFCETPCDGCLSKVLTRLADLIEPSESKVKCVAEVKVDGERLEKLVHDAAVGLTGIDRDALLEVLDEMDITVRCAGPDVERDYVEDWANEIRKAMGVIAGKGGRARLTLGTTK